MYTVSSQPQTRPL